MIEEELTKKQIRKAIREKHCPFCEGKDFFVTFDLAGRGFYFEEDGSIEWGEKDEDSIEVVECNICKGEIPKEIWEKWKLER